MRTFPNVVPKLIPSVAAGLLLTLVAGAAHAAASKEEKQQDIRAMAKEALADLYAKEPKAKAAVEGAAGYAVFSNFGLKILVAGSGKGQGIAVNSKTRAETFMKMLEVQAGLGFGAKKFRQIWVFKTASALDKFIQSGWEGGGQATAAAKSDEGGAALGGAIAVAPDVWLYQVTQKGLALELTVKGTKYSVDEDLN
jgi:lipid-binding SYLF domain-containing protein